MMDNPWMTEVESSVRNWKGPSLYLHLRSALIVTVAPADAEDIKRLPGVIPVLEYPEKFINEGRLMPGELGLYYGVRLVMPLRDESEGEWVLEEYRGGGGEYQEMEEPSKFGKEIAELANYVAPSLDEEPEREEEGEDLA